MVADATDWEVLERGSYPVAGTPVVGIQANKGNISFNHDAYLALGSPEAVDILFNRQKRLIGFRPAKKTSKNYPLNQSGNSRTYLVSGRMLVKAMQLDTSKARRYDAEMKDGLLVVDLNTEGSVATRGPLKQAQKDAVDQESVNLLAS